MSPKTKMQTLVKHWKLPLGKAKTEKYAKILFEEADKLPAEKVKIFGKEIEVKNRRVQAYSLKGKGGTYGYSGRDGNQRPHLDSRDTKVGRIVEKIAKWFDDALKKEGYEFESATAILQLFKECPAGQTPSASNNGLTWHDDRSDAIDPDSVVASFVFGEARPVDLISNETYHKKGVRNTPEKTIRPGHGDAYAMLKGVQKTHKHRVRPGRKRRISITYRAKKR